MPQRDRAAPTANGTREQIVKALRDTFRTRGYEGSTLSVLAGAAGLGRASLYHHFPGGKDEMADAAMTSVERELAEGLLAPLAGAGSPGERLGAMLASLDAYYESGRKGCLLAVLALNRGEHGLSARVVAALQDWLAALTALAREAGFSDAEDRAETALSILQGGLVLAAGLDDVGPFRRALERSGAVLLG